jgi:hypothetical protein
MKYIYCSKLRHNKKVYHMITDTGTLCKFENSSSYSSLDIKTNTIPVDRRLCKLCGKVNTTLAESNVR